MKKTISILLLFLFLLLLLCNPLLTVQTAAEGLTLWYQQILPALLPFAILSDVLIASNAFSLIARYIYPIVHLILPCSQNGTFPLAAGYLFGFPMGSRICAQMVNAGKLSSEEASVIFVVSNNISPIFISSYVVHEMLGNDALLLPAFVTLYLPPFIYGRICYRRIDRKNMQKESAPRLKFNFSIVDAGIMNSFEVLCKLGGYIMLFGIVTGMLIHYGTFSMFRPLTEILSISLEITNGIALLDNAYLAPQLEYCFILMLTAFGGICGIAQTYAMVSNVKLPMRRYITAKIILALISGVLAYFTYPLLA